MYQDIYGEFYSSETIEKPGIRVDCEVFKGRGLTGRWNLVVVGFFQAPGKGREAIEMVRQRLQTLADESSSSVVHLADPDNGRSKRFFIKLSNEGDYQPVYFGDQIYYLRQFQPRHQ
jgi:hypothetical protein